MRTHIVANALGIGNINDDEIVIFFYGPRGGRRSVEAMAPDQARSLRDALTRELMNFKED